jgi:hypothetical protein
VIYREAIRQQRCLGAPVLMSEHRESSPLVVVQLRHCSPVSVPSGKRYRAGGRIKSHGAQKATASTL